MRHAATMIALCIALLSGVVLALLWAQTPIRSSSVRAAPPAQVEATALSFYQAVNIYLDGGDDAALRQILHPDFVSHSPGSATGGNAADFMRQLDSMRALFPGLHLQPEVMYVGSNTVSVSLSLSPQQRREFAGIGIDPVDVVGRLDLVRIERRLIVERRSSAPLAGELDSFPALAIELPVALKGLVARVQQIALDGASPPALNQFGHLVLIVQSGEARLEVLEPATIPAVMWRQDQGRASDPASFDSGIPVTLEQMEAVFLPAGTQFHLWDDGDGDTVLLALEFGPPVAGELSPPPPLLEALGNTLWSGMSLTGVGGGLTLSFGRATLFPQATLSSQQVEGLELTWVGNGEIELFASNGTARVRDASGVRSEFDEGHALLRAGYAGAAGPGSDIGYLNASNRPATVWFFSMVPTGNESSEHDADAPTPMPRVPPRQNVS